MNEDARMMAEAAARAREALDRAAALTTCMPEGLRSGWESAVEDWKGAWGRLDALAAEACSAALAVPADRDAPSGRRTYTLEYRPDGVWAVSDDGDRRRVTAGPAGGA